MGLPKITTDDWQQALKESGFGQDQYPEAKTIKELREIWGCGPHAALEKAEHLISHGLAQRVRRTEVGTDGRRQHKNAYLLTDKKPTKGKPK